jgi:hypothetical protein
MSAASKKPAPIDFPIEGMMLIERGTLDRMQREGVNASDLPPRQRDRFLAGQQPLPPARRRARPAAQHSEAPHRESAPAVVIHAPTASAPKPVTVSATHVAAAPREETIMRQTAAAKSTTSTAPVPPASAQPKPAPSALTEDDREFCRTYGLDTTAFAATRARELAERAGTAAKVAEATPAAAPPRSADVQLTEDDEKLIEMSENAGVSNARAKYIEARREELARKQKAAR